MSKSNNITFEIEDCFGSTMLGFELQVDTEGNVRVLKTQDCSHADTTRDYIFDTYNKLVRIQSDNIINWHVSNDVEVQAEIVRRELI